MSGVEILTAHLEEVHAAGSKLTADGPRLILTKSVRALQTRAKRDGMIDRYHEQGGDVTTTVRGNLASATAVKLNFAEYRDAVRWLTDRGWIAPLRTDRKTVVYSFAVGRPA